MLVIAEPEATGCGDRVGGNGEGEGELKYGLWELMMDMYLDSEGRP